MSKSTGLPSGVLIRSMIVNGQQYLIDDEGSRAWRPRIIGTRVGYEELNDRDRCKIARDHLGEIRSAGEYAGRMARDHLHAAAMGIRSGLFKSSGTPISPEAAATAFHRGLCKILGEDTTETKWLPSDPDERKEIVDYCAAVLNHLSPRALRDESEAT